MSPFVTLSIYTPLGTFIKALIRDRFRCVISGSFDTRSLLRSQELKGELREAKGRFAATKCAHIIPESIHVQLSTHPDNVIHYFNGHCSSNIGRQRENTTAVWGIFDTFGYKPHLDELNGLNIHRLENVITLDPNVHDLFNRLSLWLVPTVIPHFILVFPVLSSQFIRTNLISMKSKPAMIYFLNLYPSTSRSGVTMKRSFLSLSESTWIYMLRVQGWRNFLAQLTT